MAEGQAIVWQARNDALRWAQQLMVAIPFLLSTGFSEAADDQPAFDIFEFQVTGSTLLPSRKVEAAVYPFLGLGKHIDDVELARKALEQAYRDAGYATVVVDIPEQRVDSGMVTLQVVEAKVSRTRVMGSRYYLQGQILAQVPSVGAGNVPNFHRFEKELMAVNRFPGARVTPELHPGPVPGTTEVDLRVEDKHPLSGSLELNNHYSPNTTHLRLTGQASYANLWQAQHRFSLQYQTNPQETSEAKVWVGTYLIPLQESNRMLAMYYVRSRSSVAALGDINVIGNGDIYGLRLVTPLAPAGDLNHSLTLGLDYKDFQENVTQVGTPGVQTPIRYWPFSLSYGGSREDKAGQWEFSTGVTWGFRDSGSSDLAFDNKRYKAHGNFLVYKWDLQRTQVLSKSWSLVARMDGQFSDQPLVSNEEMSAGGAATVRGYLESEQIGDNGVHSSLELRGPALWSDRSAASLRPHLFVEGAYLWLNEPLPSQTAHFALSSAGTGLRFSVGKRAEAVLEAAWPLRSSQYSPAGSARLQFLTVLRF